jgi:hypothetical protein
MRGISKSSLVLVLSVTFLSSVAAQTDSPHKSPKPAGQRSQVSNGNENSLTQDQQMALLLLDQLFDKTQSFDDERLKIKVQARIADLLWPYDEARSRRLFEEAFRAISSAKFSNQGGMPAALPSASPQAQLRGEVLRLVSQHDSRLAETLIKSVADEASKAESTSPSQPAVISSAQSDLYLQAATGLISTDTTQALQLAKTSLQGGLSSSLLPILFSLRQTNPPMADDLFGAALVAAQRDTEHVGTNIQMLAAYALPDYRTAMLSSPDYSQVPTAAGQEGNSITTGFLNFAYNALMGKSNAAQTGSPGMFNVADYYTAQQLLPYYTRYMPDKVTAFRTMIDMMTHNIPPGAGDMISRLSQPSSSEDLVKNAEATSDPMQKDIFYLRAVSQMTGSQDFDKALSLLDKVDNKELGAALDSVVRTQATQFYLNKKDIDSAYNYAKDASDVLRRSALLASIARALLSKKDTVRATEILNTAEKLIDKADDGLDKASAMLIITDAKSRLDPEMGFASMEATVKAFNDADASASSNNAPKKAGGSSFIAAMLAKTFKKDTSDFGQEFTLLSRTDFNRTLSLAQSLKKPERSVQAQLAVCRAVLVNPTRKTPKPSSREHQN